MVEDDCAIDEQERSIRIAGELPGRRAHGLSPELIPEPANPAKSEAVTGLDSRLGKLAAKKIQNRAWTRPTIDRHGTRSNGCGDRARSDPQVAHAALGMYARVQPDGVLLSREQPLEHPCRIDPARQLCFENPLAHNLTL